MKLKAFGINSMFHAQGYDLSLIASHLETMIDAESEDIKTFKGLKRKRLALVESALQNINDALEMGNENY